MGQSIQNQLQGCFQDRKGQNQQNQISLSTQQQNSNKNQQEQYKMQGIEQKSSKQQPFRRDKSKRKKGFGDDTNDITLKNSYYFQQLLNQQSNSQINQKESQLINLNQNKQNSQHEIIQQQQNDQQMHYANNNQSQQNSYKATQQNDLQILCENNDQQNQKKSFWMSCPKCNKINWQQSPKNNYQIECQQCQYSTNKSYSEQDFQQNTITELNKYPKSHIMHQQNDNSTQISSPTYSQKSSRSSIIKNPLTQIYNADLPLNKNKNVKFNLNNTPENYNDNNNNKQYDNKFINNPSQNQKNDFEKLNFYQSYIQQVNSIQIYDNQINEFVNKNFSNEQQFQQNSKQLYESFIQHNKEQINLIISSIKSILQQNDHQKIPIQLCLAIKVIKFFTLLQLFFKALKTIMEKYCTSFYQVKQINDELLKNLKPIALYDSKNLDLNKGEKFFGSTDKKLQQMGAQMLFTVLESIMIWPIWYPDPALSFVKFYSELKSDLIFPSQFTIYKNPNQTAKILSSK